jgi:hypothetical protein
MKVEFHKGILHAIPENEYDLKKIIDALRRGEKRELVSFGISKDKPLKVRKKRKRAKTILVNCVGCGTKITAKNLKKKYCPVCKKERQKEADRKYQAKKKKTFLFNMGN